MNELITYDELYLKFPEAKEIVDRFWAISRAKLLKYANFQDKDSKYLLNANLDILVRDGYWDIFINDFNNYMNQQINSNEYTINLSRQEIIKYLYNNTEINNAIIKFLKLFVADRDGQFNTINELIDMDIAIGQEVMFKGDFEIDQRKRDKPFVYIDGKILFGDKYELHTDIIQNYLGEEYDPQNTYKPRIRSINDINKHLKNKQYDSNIATAYGHIWKGIGFIEIADHCTFDEVKDKLLAQTEIPVKKIYEYRKHDYIIKRLAKKI